MIGVIKGRGVRMSACEGMFEMSIARMEGGGRQGVLRGTGGGSKEKAG